MRTVRVESIGAELAVAQHIEDLLLERPRGRAKLFDVVSARDAVEYSRAVRELAAWLAGELVGNVRDP
jgi:hypothetical protein